MTDVAPLLDIPRATEHTVGDMTGEGSPLTITDAHSEPSVDGLSNERRAVVMETATRVAVDILGRRAGVEALTHIADAARILAKARYAALGVARPNGTGLSEFVSVGLPPEEEARIGARPQGIGVLDLLLQRREPLRIDRLSDNPNSSGFPPNHPPMNSFLGVPICRGEIVIGSLYLTEKEGGGSFTADDEAAVVALGAHAAVAIYHMQLLERQRGLVSGLIHAQEEERRAIAYDLHDGLTQFVMASHAHLEAFRRAHRVGDGEKADRELDQGLLYLKEAVVESRRLVNGLRTLALDDLGLAGALEQLIAEEKARAGWDDATLITNVAGRRFDKSLETAVYRIAQEALTNARRHSGTSRVRLLLMVSTANEIPDSDEERLNLEVRDWGGGFALEERENVPGHVGLQSMAARARLLDGQSELITGPGEGTMVKANFPVQPVGMVAEGAE